MKTGLMLCDAVDEAQRERTGGYSAMFLNLLRLADPEATVRDYDVIAGEYPADIDECDCYLVTGSRHGVYDDLPWLEPLRDFIRRLRDAGKPLIGICFGHQLIAQALGGEAGKSEKGWGLGVHDSQVSCAAPWMQETGVGDTVTLAVCHQDQVFSLPAGGEKFLASEFCPNAAYTLGDSVLCFQGHPEFDAEYTRYLIDKRGKDLGDDERARMHETAGRACDTLLVSRWIRDFAARSHAAGART